MNKKSVLTDARAVLIALAFPGLGITEDAIRYVWAGAFLGFTLAVLLGFQSLYGYVYRQTGLLFASFLAGLCLGTSLATAAIGKKAKSGGYERAP